MRLWNTVGARDADQLIPELPKFFVASGNLVLDVTITCKDIFRKPCCDTLKIVVRHSETPGNT
jgi:hypothetical protein